MLELSRKKSERVVIECKGERFEIVVLRTKEDEVKLGFDAGPNVRIARKEIAEILDRVRETVDAKLDIYTEAAKLAKEWRETNAVDMPPHAAADLIFRIAASLDRERIQQQGE